MNEETKDCTRLPVVAWQVEFPLGNGAKVYEQRPSWAYESYGDLAYVTHELCRLTDAQARLAEKNARIAQLAAHARGKNKALANALKEIERLKRTIETGLDNELALVGERTELRAQLEKLQSAPAEPWISVSERLPDIAQEVIVHAQFDGVCAGVLDSYGEWFAPSSDYKLTRVNSWMPMPAAPATTDSDVREVKE